MSSLERSLPQKISDIKRCVYSSGVNVDPENMTEFVEAPLVDACIELWNKGIRTSSTNATLDAGDPAYIIINYDFLSASNINIAGDLGGEVYESSQDGIPTKYIRFTYPINFQTSPKGVADWSMSLANQFKLQPAKWEIHYSFDAAYQQGIILDIDLDPEGFVDAESVAKRSELFYSESDEMFFIDERGFRRFHQGEEE